MVTRSCFEVEYRVIASTTCELVWLKGLLANLGCLCITLMIVFCDNQVVMHIASNLIFHEWTKYIEVDCHYIHQQVQSKLITTHYVCINDQLTYLLTKVMLSTKFHRLMSKLASINPLDPAWGARIGRYSLLVLVA